MVDTIKQFVIHTSTLASLVVMMKVLIVGAGVIGTVRSTPRRRGKRCLGSEALAQDR